MTLSILAIEYLEQDYQQTRTCIEATGLPVIYQARDPKGSGSLAEAINDGLQHIRSTYCFIVTNILFKPDVPERLMFQLSSLNDQGYKAMSPAFSSDHPFCRPNNSDQNKEVPFIEFTAALVKTSTIRMNLLDREMPYWGHDMDWGYRLRKLGLKLAVCPFITIDHTYIRNNQMGEVITAIRQEFRKATDYQTERALVKKYGPKYESLLKSI
jgi:hypothetical protein